MAEFGGSKEIIVMKFNLKKKFMLRKAFSFKEFVNINKLFHENV